MPACPMRVAELSTGLQVNKEDVSYTPMNHTPAREGKAAASRANPIQQSAPPPRSEPSSAHANTPFSERLLGESSGMSSCVSRCSSNGRDDAHASSVPRSPVSISDSTTAPVSLSHSTAASASLSDSTKASVSGYSRPSRSTSQSPAQAESSASSNTSSTGCSAELAQHPEVEQAAPRSTRASPSRDTESKRRAKKTRKYKPYDKHDRPSLSPPSTPPFSPSPSPSPPPDLTNTPPSQGATLEATAPDQLPSGSCSPPLPSVPASMPTPPSSPPLPSHPFRHSPDDDADLASSTRSGLVGFYKRCQQYASGYLLGPGVFGRWNGNYEPDVALRSRRLDTRQVSFLASTSAAGFLSPRTQNFLDDMQPRAPSDAAWLTSRSGKKVRVLAFDFSPLAIFSSLMAYYGKGRALSFFSLDHAIETFKMLRMTKASLKVCSDLLPAWETIVKDSPYEALNAVIDANVYHMFWLAAVPICMDYRTQQRLASVISDSDYSPAPGSGSASDETSGPGSRFEARTTSKFVFDVHSSPGSSSRSSSRASYPELSEKASNALRDYETKTARSMVVTLLAKISEDGKILMHRHTWLPEVFAILSCWNICRTCPEDPRPIIIKGGVKRRSRLYWRSILDALVQTYLTQPPTPGTFMTFYLKTFPDIKKKLGCTVCESCFAKMDQDFEYFGRLLSKEIEKFLSPV